jgi:predicted nucleotidyltransferase
VNRGASRPDRSLETAAKVARILVDLGVESALIGAAALAAHGYPRATEDIDLAVATDPFSVLEAARQRISADLAVEATLALPDAADPLGGVLTVTGEDFDPIQVVNFVNPMGSGLNPGAEAIRTAVSGIVEGTSLRVVDLPHLVALKLYAGGPKSMLDVIEVLDRNPDADREAIRAVCRRFSLARAWSAILRRLEG